MELLYDIAFQIQTDWSEGIEFIMGLDFLRFITVFWAFFFLEMPRYFLADFYVFFRHLRKLDQGTPVSTQGRIPKVSIILSALNEGKTIKKSVHSLQEQDYPNIEIVVVDDGSTDNTASICTQLAKEGLIRFFPSKSRQGKSGALNYGCRMATGEFIVFMDSDSTLDRQAIRNILGGFSGEHIGAVGGNVGVRNTYTNLLTRIQMAEYLTSITVGRIFRAHLGILGIISGAFGAFRRPLLNRVGWHEPGPGNDSDLTIRIRKLDKQVAFAPRAICLTNAPTKWIQWFKQRSRWNRNIVRNRLRKHKDTFNFFQGNFSWSNLFSFFDILFFSFFLAFAWMVYLFFLIFVEASSHLWMILVINYCLYTGSKFFQLILGLIVSGRIDEDVRILWITPIMPLYRIVEKFVRVTAYSQEFLFRASYRDPFAPEKVQHQMNVY